MIIHNHFRNKKVLVTGHTGFKGSWLTLWLHKLGAKVTGISLDPKSHKDAYYALGIGSCCEDLRCDIRKYDDVKRIFEITQPEIVFHLAAQPLVLDSYENPLYTYETNVMGTAHILEAARFTKSIKQAILITTDKVYENKEVVWGYRENDPLGGCEPYGTSKAAAEMVIAGYKNSFFKNKASIASVRAGNVVGGGDWAKNRIIPDCINSLNQKREIEVRNPHAVRPWQHVLEALGGYLLLSAKLNDEPEKYAQSWNFGPGLEGLKNVQSLVEKLIESYGEGSWVSLQKEKTLYESGILALDISKAYVELNWKPLLSFSETVDWTVQWYKAYKNEEDMKSFTLDQIKNYEERWSHSI
jgi:CDP-glucose 4,6-dehydratase